MSRIDRSRRRIAKKGFEFEPFRPKKSHEMPLSELVENGLQELMVFERGGERRALLLSEMVYHHVCQGELAGEPYLVTF